MIDRIQKRFDELEKLAATILDSQSKEATRVPSNVQQLGEPTAFVPATKYIIDDSALIQWATSVKSLLHRVFGPNEPTYLEFDKSTRSRASNVHSTFAALRAIFMSAKTSFEGGYLFDVKNLVHAEVFSDELDQAKHFLDKNFKVPAAVIAGTVLETTLRGLCESHPNLVPADNINKMNDDLAKEPVYNKMVADQVRAWAKIRNDAAHGHPDEFENSQVNLMITGIRDFVAKHMS